MLEEDKTTIIEGEHQCKVFDHLSEARKYGPGGIVLKYIPGSLRRFPEDVQSLVINMPVKWGESIGLFAEWTVSHKNVCGAQWVLSGSIEQPTLSPSLHWVDVWHGFLTNGILTHC